MYSIIFYYITLLAFVALGIHHTSDNSFSCCLVGLLGGVLYCKRAIYLNKCVHKRWSKDWIIWYWLRPIASFICGYVSFLFIESGLLILDSEVGDMMHGYQLLSFIAGYNVDKFLAKAEKIAQSVWGIDKSRSSKD